jgi:Transposase DDE domain group 1
MPKGLRNIEFLFGDPSLTHFGGMALFQRFCRKLDLKHRLQTYVPWERRDSRYDGAELLLCLIYTMVAGLQRISDTRILAYNKSFQKLLGLSRFPAENTLRNFLRSLNAQGLAGIIKVHDLLRARMRELPRPRTSYTLDMDSTVLPVYGWTIEGAEIGYNPKKPRRPSYHPLVCFEGHTQDSLHGMLRPGDTHPVTVAEEFFRACLAKLPIYANRKKVAVRLPGSTRAALSASSTKTGWDM